MRALTINELKDEEICKPEHQFCRLGEPRKMICTDSMPIQFNVKGSASHYSFISKLIASVATCRLSLPCHLWGQWVRPIISDSTICHWPSIMPCIAPIYSTIHHSFVCYFKGPVRTFVAYAESRAYPQPPHKCQNIFRVSWINIMTCLVQHPTI